MTITDNIIDLESECIDGALALIVVGGYMLGCFMGVEIPIEMPAGILAYHFIVRKP